MAHASYVQDGGIVFGDWKLFPLDDLNWELCRKREITRGSNAGKVEWRPCGKYYDCHTVGGAVRYAADAEMKELCQDSHIDLADAMDEHMRIVKRLCDELRASVEAREIVRKALK
jgi:hypothetical protein